jgi:enolase
LAAIKKVVAREILDSRGNPTVEADVYTDDGIKSASVPSGASTGTYEALELRDGDNKRYNGKGVLKAVANVNNIISKNIIGLNCEDQEKIDKLMLKLDGTENKSKLGANAILAVSMAVCKAGAASKGIPLYKHIADLGENKKLILPVPMVLVLEGGKHADQSSDLQEFMVMPYKAKAFKDAIRWGSEIYHSIGKVLKKQGFNINVGYEGAYGPSLGSNEKVLKVIVDGIKEAGYKPGENIAIAIDGAASEFFDNGKYHLSVDGRTLDGKGMADFYSSLIEKYPIASIEDGLSEDDWNSWAFLTKKIGKYTQIVGDDLTVTNVKRLQKAIDMKAINSVLIKVNQIGTVTETINAINLAKKNNCTAVVSHRSAETEDTFIADFVVGMGTGQCKFGAPARSERAAKYNRLMRIEEELGNKAEYYKF